MMDFDSKFKKLSMAEPVAIPPAFEARNDALIAGLVTPAPRRRHRRAAFILKSAAAAVLIIALLTGAAYAAYSLSGGEYFRQLFSRVAAGDAAVNYGYMNTDQLDVMSSSTVGRVVDTDELSVDVLGVIVSGNTAQFDVLVTAKKLDTVLYDTGIVQKMNYRFHEDWDIFLYEDGVKKDPRGSAGSIQHIYSDKDKSLAPNQFIIRYTYISEEQLKGKTYIMTFKDFGYFDFDEPDQFVELYEGEWPFTIAFDPAGDTSKTVMPGRHLSAGEYSFTVDSVSITPLAITVKFSNDEEYYDMYDHRWSDVVTALSRKVSDLTVKLADGTVLDSTQFDINGPGGGEPGHELYVEFKVPISVDQVVSVTLGGVEIPLG
jgi:hypothetical protein